MVVWISNLFLLIAEQYSLVLDNSHFIHLPVGRYLGCFQFGAIMNKVTVNMHGQASLWVGVCLGEYLGVE